MNILKTLDPELDSALIGMVLGDGHLKSGVSGASLIMEHRISNTDFLKWKSSLLPIDWHSKMKVIVARQRLDGYPRSDTIRFETYRVPELLSLREEFYGEIGEKRIDLYILDRISILGIAIWIMDDGSMHKRSRTISLGTHSFSKDENELIRDWFHDKFSITSTVTSQNQYWYLNFNINGTKILIDMIRDYVNLCPSMKYKIDQVSYVQKNKRREVRSQSLTC